MSRTAIRAIVRRGDKLLVMRRDKFGERYYTLIGGGIYPGESAQQTLARQLQNEAGMRLTKAQPVFKEEVGDPYGTQYMYLCDCEGEEPVLSENTEEAKINKLGQNLYTPQWISVEEFRTVQFRTERLRQAILSGIENGFPEKPMVL